MSQRYIVRAENMRRSGLEQAVKELGKAGIACEVWDMDTVYLGHGLIAIEIEEADVRRVQDIMWQYNNGAFVGVSPDVDYDEEYSALGVDIPR